jgi:NAD(P)-dependent dehydrogenase (short-subunit alcohol dehydrogenase family)
MADGVVAEIEAAGGDAVASYDTVATREGADGIVWTALSRFGRIDVLVNNAGILRDRTVLNMSEDDLDRVLDVHLRGTFLCTQAAARAMKVRGDGGRIVNTTSLSGLFEKFGVTVNAVAPVALTRMTADLALMKGATEQDLGPQFISPAVVFLASPLAARITGQIVGVEGGRVFLYRMERTPGVEREGARGPWTAEDLAEAWERIAR